MGIFSRKKPEPAKPIATVADQPMVSVPVQASVSQSKVSTKMNKNNAVLVRPVITEKATANGVYLFQVTPTATKSEVRKAFKAKYGKAPRKVNILNVLGKTKQRGREIGKRANWKKAMIYLTKGETVDLYQ